MFKRMIEMKIVKPTKAATSTSTPDPTITAETAAAISNQTLNAVKGIAVAVASIMVVNALCTIAVNAAPKK